jgi:hypothetical protein
MINIDPVFGKQEFAQFVGHLLHYYHNKRLLVIHDRGEQHKGAPGEAILRDADGRLLRKPQPAYAPELNPEEHLGNLHYCSGYSPLLK